jgi:hypothetical protein
MELSGGPGNSGVRFVGEKGTMDVTRGRYRASSPELTAKPLEDLEVQLYRSENHAADWLSCIKERRDPVAHAEIGHRSVTIGHLANIARWVSEITGETGQKLKWDSQAERFTNSEEANKFLNRPFRKGFELPEVV